MGWGGGGGGGSLKHHGKVWNCHQAAFKNHRVLHSHDCWFPNISKRCQTFRNGKPKFSVFPHLKPHELQMISRKNKACEIWRFRTFPGAKDTCLDLRTNMAKCIKWRVYCIIACLQAFMNSSTFKGSGLGLRFFCLSIMGRETNNRKALVPVLLFHLVKPR